MKALVVYDSVFGNTEKVAQAMGQALEAQGEVHALRVSDVKPEHLNGLDALIVGSPTHGGWFTEKIRDWVDAAPALEGLRIAAFDTRTASIWNRILPFGYAAQRIARSLEKKGGTLLASPEGFVVLGTKGPLKEGELERAAEWGREICS